MGLQTDLFVGSPEAAAHYEGGLVADIERVQIGGFTNLEFETLWAIVEGETWDVKRHGLEELASTEASWTFRFPTAYVGKLQSLGPNDIRDVAEAWSKTEEISASPADVLPVIESLVSLAKSATAQNRDLFVWTAL